MFAFARPAGCWVIQICALIGLIGCIPLEQNEPSDTLPELVLGYKPSRPIVASDSYSEIEPNEDFDSAVPVLIEGAVELSGTIEPGVDYLDRDLFDLGPAEAGDRLLVELSNTPGYDVVLGIFDDQHRLLNVIDKASFATGPTQIDMVLRESTEYLYAVLATRAPSDVAHSYSAALTLEQGAEMPVYSPQIVVLDFQGGSDISVCHRPPIDIPSFDAANISPRFAGQNDIIIDNVLQMVAEDYAGLGVEFYLADDQYIPSGPRSTIYFGTYDERLLGLADNIDPFNSDREQSAVLYTDSFAVFEPLWPNVQQISQVLANVTSHEIGHLLGLRHTADPIDLMDTTATARQMLLDQWFTVAELYEMVLPIGVQDSPALLSWTVGGVLAPLPAGKSVSVLRKQARSVAGAAGDFYVDRSQLASCEHPAQ